MSPAPFRFPRSIATVSLAGTLPEKLEAAGSVGSIVSELFENDLLTCFACRTEGKGW
jgi:4-hydroxyphenylpyruvate dioxygenase